MPRTGKAAALSAAIARATVDSLGDAVVVVGVDGGILHLNPAAEELFERSRERAIDLPVRSLPGGTPLASIAERARVAQESQSVELPVPRGTGTVTLEATPLMDGAACAGAVLLLRRPRATEQTLDFEALAAGLAHEIKNPLAGLQGSAELLAREAEGAIRDYAQVIAREAKRVDGLVRELLDLARPAALQTGPVDLHEVIGNVLVLVRGFPGADRIRFSERYDPSLPAVQGDEEKLTQVLLNLLRNAVEASPAADAVIQLETGVASLRVRARGGRTCPLVRVAVLDNGAGIPEAMIGRLFTPFATSKPHGTGLGLAISRRIVEAHGGRMEVKNRSEGGAEAAVYLPLDVSRP